MRSPAWSPSPSRGCCASAVRRDPERVRFAYRSSRPPRRGVAARALRDAHAAGVGSRGLTARSRAAVFGTDILAVAACCEQLVDLRDDVDLARI
jgi:hypothetical protein